MASEDRNRAEYLRRIHRAMDYVERHLGGPLPLAVLAREACFSPFHFHRIFAALTGEPVAEFVRRVRLECAASRLRNNVTTPVTDIALECGFSSSAVFARAFREQFGMTPTRWRAGATPAGGPEQADSKERTTERKGRKDRHGAAAYALGTTPAVAAGATQARSIPMQPTTEKQPLAPVRVEKRDPLFVAYVRHTGPYKGNADLFRDLFTRIMAWAGPRGFVECPGAQVLSVYHDDPNVTEEGKQRVSACVAVPPGTAGSGEVGTMEIPGGRYAVARFEMRTEDYQAAWNHMWGGWLPGSGFEPAAGPCFERYLSEPAPEGAHIVEIGVPVKALG